MSRKQNERIVALYEDGYSPTQIAEKLGTTAGTVHHRLNVMGIARRPLGMTSEQIDEAVAMRESGMAVQKIAAQLGFAYNTVRKELLLRGMK